MEPVFLIVGLAVLLPVVALLVSYNRFVRQRNLVRDSWANVDAELQRRYDLIPNLVRTVQGYADHERQIFEHVAAARARALAETGSPARAAEAENELVRGVRSVLGLAEAYPDLKASHNFLELQRELAITEDRIQAARRFYNANVRDLNIRVQAVPSNLVARWFGFKEADYFEIEEAVREVPTV